MTQKYKQEKELILSMFCRLTEKLWGWHIFGQEKRYGKQYGQKQSFTICKDLELSNLHYKKIYLREKPLISQQKSMGRRVRQFYIYNNLG